MRNLYMQGFFMDKRERLVTQANQLIEGAYEVNLTEIRLLYLALTKIDPRREQPESEYIIYPSEFNDMYSLGRIGYTQLKQAVSGLARKPIITYESDNTTVERFWFSSIKYTTTGEGFIVVKFSDSVREALYELRQEFTQMNLNELVKLDTQFAFRLYSWLYRYRRLDKYTNSQRVITTEPFGIEWMKERVGLTGKYPKLTDFRNRVLDPAIDMINAHTNLSVSYEMEKKGKQVRSFVFSYIDEKEHNVKALAPVKPLRPRLPNRPRVTSGSAAEGEWARQCITVMKNFQTALKAYDPKLRINTADRKKVEAWYSIIGLQMDGIFNRE
ncbi:replication initiation protein (plasmid) [Rouxiella badensis subsp. acadiensis]|nr:replication initiation protein [Rouxiella badensis subsp. acadiensis]